MNKYNTKEIAIELSDFAGLLEANLKHMESVMDRDTIESTVTNLDARIKRLKEMANYLYNAKESI